MLQWSLSLSIPWTFYRGDSIWGVTIDEKRLLLYQSILTYYVYMNLTKKMEIRLFHILNPHTGSAIVKTAIFWNKIRSLQVKIRTEVRATIFTTNFLDAQLSLLLEQTYISQTQKSNYLFSKMIVHDVFHIYFTLFWHPLKLFKLALGTLV